MQALDDVTHFVDEAFLLALFEFDGANQQGHFHAGARQAAARAKTAPKERGHEA